MGRPKGMQRLRRAARLTVALACLGLFGACSGGDEATRKDEGRPLEMKSEAGNTNGFGPVSAPPGFEEVTGDGFTVAVPPGFKVDRKTSSNGERMLLLNAAESPGSVVGVVRDVRPRADAIEQSITLESSARVVHKATDVTREEIEWPGAQRAALIQWTAPDQHEGVPPQPFRTVQLMAQVNPELILSVVATAPAASFEQAGVGTVLRTFRPRQAAS